MVGALACVQGVLGARSHPADARPARDLLRATGSPQQDAPGRPATQRIGNRPDLRQLIPQRDPAGLLDRRPVHRHAPAQPDPAVVHLQLAGPLARRLDGHADQSATGGPQLGLTVQVERATDRYATYWLTVQNLTNQIVNFEGRYAVLGW